MLLQAAVHFSELSEWGHMCLELRALAGWLAFGDLQGLAAEAFLACRVGLRPLLLTLLLACP